MIDSLTGSLIDWLTGWSIIWSYLLVGLSRNWRNKHARHWLQVQARIDGKRSTVGHSFFSDSSPARFSDLRIAYTPYRQLCSSAETRILRIPHVRTNVFGQRCFSYCAPKQWNSLLSTESHSILTCLQNCVKNSSNNTTTGDFKFLLANYLQLVVWMDTWSQLFGWLVY